MEIRGEDSIVEERNRAIQDLAAVASFMQALPELNGKEKRLLVLLEALHDLGENRRNSFLKPAKKAGRPKVGYIEEVDRARAATAMEMFMRAGLPS